MVGFRLDRISTFKSSISRTHKYVTVTTTLQLSSKHSTTSGIQTLVLLRLPKYEIRYHKIPTYRTFVTHMYISYHALQASALPNAT